MNLSDAASIAVIIGTAIAAIIAGVGVIRFVFGRIKHSHELEKARRERRRSDILTWMTATQEALAQYDLYISGGLRSTDHGLVIGKARAAMLAAGDTELTRIAEEILTPRRIAEDDGSEAHKTYGTFINRNRQGLSMAVQRFAVLLKEAS